MFIDPNEYVKIKILYKKVGLHFIANSEEAFEELSPEEREGFKELNLVMRQLTWGLYNDLQEASMNMDDLGNRNFNYKHFKENKLTKLIVKWDAKKKNDAGEIVDVPVNNTTVSQLSPDIAETILNVYDKKSLIDDDTAKKLPGRSIA